MKYTYHLVIVMVCFFMVSFKWVVAHGNGVIFTKLVGQDIEVKLEHETVELVEGESTPISIEVLRAGEPLEIDWIFVRISNEMNLVLSSSHATPETLIPKIVRIITTFYKQGEHTINLRIKLKDVDETIRTEFMVNVKPTKIDYLQVWGPSIALTGLGLLGGLLTGASLWRRKNI